MIRVAVGVAFFQTPKVSGQLDLIHILQPAMCIMYCTVTLLHSDSISLSICTLLLGGLPPDVPFTLPPDLPLALYLDWASCSFLISAKVSVDRGQPPDTSLSSKESNCQSSTLASTASS